jgi:hypothetical protein
MDPIILTLSPLVVALVSQFVKKIALSNLVGYRKVVLRFLTAVLSFGAVVSTAMLAGQEVELLAIETFSSAFLVFIGATGAYFLGKTK